MIPTSLLYSKWTNVLDIELNCGNGYTRAEVCFKLLVVYVVWVYFLDWEGQFKTVI